MCTADTIMKEVRVKGGGNKREDLCLDRGLLGITYKFFTVYFQRSFSKLPLHKDCFTICHRRPTSNKVGFDESICKRMYKGNYF